MRLSEEDFAAHQKRVKGGESHRLEHASANLKAGGAHPTKRGQLRKRKGPNKTEAAFGEWLKHQWYQPIGFEAMTLRMPGGTRYTPDWSSSDPDNPADGISFWEVKGFMREAARVRLKEFAAHFTMFRFFLVRAKDRSLTSWEITEVN